MLQISVIIPVYNAAEYVAQAVESALSEPETAEIILVEDGSPDESQAVCAGIATQHEKVRLLRHPKGENLGAGASRNLGIINAQFDYIAFLDADDFYLPDRFLVAKERFETDPECDGVYEAVYIDFENECAKERWINSPMAGVRMTTMRSEVPPKELFERLILGGAGYFSIDGLTIKKSVMKKSGLMNEGLALHEDTDFIFRLAAVARLLPGQLDKPVTIRRVHELNRISAPRSETAKYKDRLKMWQATHNWLSQNHFNAKKQIVLEKILRFCVRSKPLPVWMQNFPKEIRQLTRLSLFPVDYPLILTQKAYWKKISSIKFWPVFKRNIRKIKFF
jgi:glycosyltransferase involved in cell wall biosynthesis